MQENVDSMNFAFDTEVRGHEARREDKADGEEWVDAAAPSTADGSEAGVGDGGAPEPAQATSSGDTGGQGRAVEEAGDVGDALADAVEDGESDNGGGAAEVEGGPFDMSASTILQPTPSSSFAKAGLSVRMSSSTTTPKPNTTISRPGMSARTSAQGSGSASASASASGLGPFAFAQRSNPTSTSTATRTSNSTAGPSGSAASAGGASGASRSAVDARRRMFEKPSAGSTGAKTGAGGMGGSRGPQDFRAGGKA